MGDQRHYGPQEYERTEGAPLPPHRLVAIWRQLPERDRLGFVLSLEETIADRVVVLTAAPAEPAEKEPNQ